MIVFRMVRAHAVPRVEREQSAREFLDGAYFDEQRYAFRVLKHMIEYAHDLDAME